MYYTLDLQSDNSERITYNRPEIPVFAKRGRLSNFLNFAVTSHWHDDVEFSVILSGQMTYNVNGTAHIIEQGNGIFVNSRQFHGNFSVNGADCEYICVLLHPILLCANQFLEKTCVIPVISNDAFPYSVLRRDVPWNAKLMADVYHIVQLYDEWEKASDLLVQSLFFHIWSILYEHMPDAAQLPIRSGNRLSALHDMIGFLQRHYNEKITLSDIAAAGKVCQSKCCAIFSEYLHQTPIRYLTGYRLNKSAELLKHTSMSITEVAFTSGFTGVSYYAETFRKYFGCTPTEYRKRTELDS